jgi:hypothetical protein
MFGLGTERCLCILYRIKIQSNKRFLNNNNNGLSINETIKYVSLINIEIMIFKFFKTNP